MVTPSHGQNEVVGVKKSASDEELQNDGDDLTDLKEDVYYNDYIMERIISFVPNIKDRVNIELCSKRMQYLSMRSPYSSYCLDNSVLDINYTMVEPTMSLNVAGNRVNVPSLTSAERIASEVPISEQPGLCILVTRALLKRFTKQIKEVRLGGITDCERRLGYIPDHQLVVTRDLCEIFDGLPHANSLSLRNCCLTADVLQYWSRQDSALMRRISSLCFHSIWFDRAEDCEFFVNIVPPNVRRLHLSDCGAQTIMNLAKRVQMIGSNVDHFYIALDFRTFKNATEALNVLKKVNTVAKELHLCICMTNLAIEPGYHALLDALPRLVDLSAITTLQLDVGAFRPLNYQGYERFFGGLIYMNNLKSLFLSGRAIAHQSLPMWSAIVNGVAQLSTLEFLSIHELCKNIRAENIDELCTTLPPTLLSFSIGNSTRFSDDNMMHLVQRCPTLVSLYLRGLRKVRLQTLASAVSSLGNLRRLAICRMGPMDESMYRLVADKHATPSLEAVILGGNRAPLSSEVLPLLHARFQTVMFICHSSRWRESEYCMWRVQEAYMELLAASWFTECPGCEKDVSLIEDDDF